MGNKNQFLQTSLYFFYGLVRFLFEFQTGGGDGP